MAVMQSKDNKMSNFIAVYMKKNFPQALRDSLKELKECRSLSFLKTCLQAA